MPLRIEVYNQQRDDWVLMGELTPSHQPWILTDNKPEGKERDIYSFQCLKDGKESVINRSVSGEDDKTVSGRLVKSEGWEEVIRLTNGESFIMPIKPDGSEQRQIVKFTHHETR